MRLTFRILLSKQTFLLLQSANDGEYLIGIVAKLFNLVRGSAITTRKRLKLSSNKKNYMILLIIHQKVQNNFQTPFK